MLPRATESDLQAIRESLEEMAENLASTNTISTAADTAFHMAIAFSTKNPVLINLTRNFYDFLFVGIKKNLGHMKEDEVAYEDVLEQHHTIFRHIKNRDPQKAHDAMHAHIIYVQNFFDKRNSIPVQIR